MRIIGVQYGFNVENREDRNMLLVYMALWYAFNERITPELTVIGLIVCAGIDLFSWKILGGVKYKGFVKTAKLIKGSIAYIYCLIREIIKCNWAVIRLIVSPRLEVEPELHTFRTKLKSDSARVTLANSITITPGTITCTVEDDKLCVHALDSELGRGVESTDFERRLLEMEEIENEH